MAEEEHEDAGRAAAVFDVDKLAWINRHYMKAAEPARIARAALPFFERDGRVRAATAAALDYVASILPLAVGSVDRLDEIPARVAFLFALYQKLTGLQAADQGSARRRKRATAPLSGAEDAGAPPRRTARTLR